MGESQSKMQETVFQLKWTAKSLARESVKCEKKMKEEKRKVQTAIKKGNMEGAKIHAANAIREKNMSLQYLRLSSRVESVSSRVDTAVRMNTITKTMGKVVTGMSHVMKSMDPEKITAVMENFEKQFEDMDVRSAYMEGSMATATASATPEQDVNSLINQVAEENQLELNEEFREAGIVGSTVPTQTESASTGPVAVPTGGPQRDDNNDDDNNAGGGSGGPPPAAPPAGGGGGGDIADSLAARLAALRG